MCVSCVSWLQALAAIEQHLEQHGLLGLPHEAVRAVYGLPPSSTLMSDSRREELKAVTPKYNQTQVGGLAGTGGRDEDSLAAAGGSKGRHQVLLVPL